MSYSKVKITGKIEVITGLHIGSGGEFSAIGAIDSPIIRDPQTKMPLIPGSSLKGKLRSLLSREISNKRVEVSEDAEQVNRLFGSSVAKDANGRLIQARLQISDAFYNTATKSRFEKQDIPFTESKFENAISRLEAKSNPRQIERVTRGSVFDLVMIYNVENAADIVSDFENIQKAFFLLENDYLGGGGTRGSGRVKFQELKAVYITGERIGAAAYEFNDL